MWHLLISPVLSLIFSMALPDSLLLTSKFFCVVVPLLTKWAHLEIKLEEKKNQHSTHLTPCISTQKMLSLAQVLSSLEITTQSSILLMLHTMLKILFPLQGSQLKIKEMNYRWCRESSYSHFRNTQC